MRNLLNRILHRETAVVKRKLTTGEPRGNIVINKKAFADLAYQRKWRSDADIGRALGYTRQNIYHVLRGAHVSTDFIAKVAILTGSDVDKTYSHYFDIVRVSVPGNHQKFNMAKFKGQVPYAKYSVSAGLRRLDGEVEQES